MIIVTGAAGFIASNLIRGLNQKGYEDIIAVDNLSNANKHLNLNKLKFAEYYDKEDFINSLENFKSHSIKAIFHQGACSDTMETDGRYMMKNNYTYSKILLDFCIRNNIKFIYASSAAVYGQGVNGFEEKSDCEYPLNIYAYSKLAFDNYVRRMIALKVKNQITGLRYFNVYGYQENHKGNMSSVIYKFYQQYLEKNKIELFEGSENFLRDFIFVEDIINVNLFFMENKKSGIFNCGTGKPKSFVEVADVFKKYFPDVAIEYINFPPELQGKYQQYTQADLSNLKDIGFDNNFFELDNGIKKYLDNLTTKKGFLY